MSESTALVTVVTGRAYEEFAERMFESAREHFHPTDEVKFIRLSGREGAWPAGTMFRHHILAAAVPQTDYVFLIDADARFEERVGPEILPFPDGITATLHPGYVRRPPLELPFERNFASACYVSLEEGDTYYCGGFLGGARTDLRILSTQISGLIDTDVLNGHMPSWHDESALNRVLASSPPKVTLDPSYCHPDADAYYVEQIWGGHYPRRIVMLDKTAEVRGER